MEIRCCLNCRYYKPYEEEHPEADVDAECRRYPPQVVADGDRCMSSYPGVDPGEWCGEWKAVEHGR